jgi:transposase
MHAIVDRNIDCYCGLETISDIFGKTGKKILRETVISPVDHKVLIGYLDLMDEINKKIKDLEAQIDKRCSKDRDIYLLKSIPGVGTFTAFLVKS